MAVDDKDTQGAAKERRLSRPTLNIASFACGHAKRKNAKAEL